VFIAHCEARGAFIRSCLPRSTVYRTVAALQRFVFGPIRPLAALGTGPEAAEQARVPEQDARVEGRVVADWLIQCSSGRTHLIALHVHIWWPTVPGRQHYVA